MHEAALADPVQSKKLGFTELRDLAITGLDMGTSTDVLVVGASPVGLSLGCDAALLPKLSISAHNINQRLLI
jgi:hypothetical protein